MSAARYAMHYGTELAALRFYLATAERNADDWGTALAAIPQAYPARLASLSDHRTAWTGEDEAR